MKKSFIDISKKIRIHFKNVKFLRFSNIAAKKRKYEWAVLRTLSNLAP